MNPTTLETDDYPMFKFNSSTNHYEWVVPENEVPTARPTQTEPLNTPLVTSATSMENANGVIDLCSESGDAAIASSSATPSTAPTSLTQHNTSVFSGLSGTLQPTPRATDLPEPSLYHVGMGPHTPYSGYNHQATFAKQGAQTSVSPRLPEAHNQQGATKQPQSSNVRTTPSQTSNDHGRDLRAEYIELAGRAKRRLQAAAANVRRPGELWDRQSLQDATTQVIPLASVASGPDPHRFSHNYAHGPLFTSSERSHSISMPSTTNTSGNPVFAMTSSPAVNTGNTERGTTYMPVSGDYASNQSDMREANRTFFPGASSGGMASWRPHMPSQAMADNFTLPSSTPDVKNQYPSSNAGSQNGTPSMSNQLIANNTATKTTDLAAPASQPSAEYITISEDAEALTKSLSKPQRRSGPYSSLPFDDMPDAPKQLLLLWRSAHATDSLPFAVGSSMIPLVNRSKDGLPAIYSTETGEQVQVNIYSLSGPTSLSESKYAIIATDREGSSYIIGRHAEQNKPRIVGELGIPYCKWVGTSWRNANGWENESSIFKSWDSRRVMVPRSTALPPTHDRPASPYAVANRAKNATNDVAAPVLPTTVAPPRKHAVRKNHSKRRSGFHKPDLDPQKCYCPLPSNLRLLIEQWQVLHGSDRQPPCFFTFGNSHQVFENRHSVRFSYYHRNEDTLNVWVCRISKELSGQDPNARWKDKAPLAVMIASGPNTPLCIISTLKHSGQHTRTRPPTYPGNYHIWQGVRGEDDLGFEKESSVTKVSDNKAQSRRIGSQDVVPPLPEVAASGDTTEDETTNDEVLKFADSEPSTTAVTNTPAAVLNSLTTFVPDSNPLPKPCRDTINEWLRRHPNRQLKSLACLSSSPESTLVHTHSKKPVAWYHISGERLSVRMYAFLNAVGSLDYNPLRNFQQLAVAEGRSLPAMIFGFRGSDRYIDGSLAHYIWVGIKGDRDGWERSPSVFKCKSGARLPRKGSLVLKYGAVKAVDGGERQRQDSQVPQRQSDLVTSNVTTTPTVQPPAKRLRTERSLLGHSSIEPDDSITTTTLTTRSRTKTTTSAPPSSSKPPNAKVSIPLRQLKPHLQTHLVCLFYAHPSNSSSSSSSLSANPVPRARLFAACDSVEKLFAQATAGNVFADSMGSPVGLVEAKGVANTKGRRKGSARVLSVFVGAGRGRKVVKVVEGDEEDFEDVLDAVDGMGWWGWHEEREVVGSGSVEVRAVD